MMLKAPGFLWWRRRGNPYTKLGLSEVYKLNALPLTFRIVGAECVSMVTLASVGYLNGDCG